MEIWRKNEDLSKFDPKFLEFLKQFESYTSLVRFVPEILQEYSSTQNVDLLKFYARLTDEEFDIVTAMKKQFKGVSLEQIFK